MNANLLATMIKRAVSLPQVQHHQQQLQPKGASSSFATKTRRRRWETLIAPQSPLFFSTLAPASNAARAALSVDENSESPGESSYRHKDEVSSATTSLESLELLHEQILEDRGSTHNNKDNEEEKNVSQAPSKLGSLTSLFLPTAKLLARPTLEQPLLPTLLRNKEEPTATDLPSPPPLSSSPERTTRKVVESRSAAATLTPSNGGKRFIAIPTASELSPERTEAIVPDPPRPHSFASQASKRMKRLYKKQKAKRKNSSDKPFFLYPESLPTYSPLRPSQKKPQQPNSIGECSTAPELEDPKSIEDCLTPTTAASTNSRSTSNSSSASSIASSSGSLSTSGRHHHRRLQDYRTQQLLQQQTHQLDALKQLVTTLVVLVSKTMPLESVIKPSNNAQEHCSSLSTNGVVREDSAIRQDCDVTIKSTPLASSKCSLFQDLNADTAHESYPGMTPSSATVPSMDGIGREDSTVLQDCDVTINSSPATPSKLLLFEDLDAVPKMTSPLQQQDSDSFQGRSVTSSIQGRSVTSSVTSVSRILSQKLDSRRQEQAGAPLPPTEVVVKSETRTKRQCSGRGVVRHVRIQVDGEWGYFSGPSAALLFHADESSTEVVNGCVVRFDNGDLYLGGMKDEKFHGLGTLYLKSPRRAIRRGRFAENHFLSPDEDDGVKYNDSEESEADGENAQKISKEEEA